MLKSTDTNTKCLGIQILIERLKDTSYTSIRESAYPTNIPKMVDLFPVLMDFLCRKNPNIKVAEKLMSWDSIVGIFISTLCMHKYCPPLIIANEQSRCRTLDDMQTKIFTIYSQGLKRAKMFLKRNEPSLAHHLLSILKSVMMSPEHEELDASIKLYLQSNASYQSSLELGLLKWMSEIMLDYIGIKQDEDEEMLKEGSQWLIESGVITPAEQWFELDANIRTYIEFTIKEFLEVQQEKGDKSKMLYNMLRYLKIGNEKVFDEQLETLHHTQAKIIKNAVSSNSNYLALDDDSNLSEQTPVQKRKRDSISLDFSIKATDSDEEEGRIRKYMKVGKFKDNTIEDEVTKVKVVEEKPVEEKPVENESTGPRMGTKRKMDSSFVGVQDNKRRKSTSMDSSTVLPEKKSLDCTEVKTVPPLLFLDRFLEDPKIVDNDLLQSILKVTKETRTTPEICGITCPNTELWTQKKGELFMLLSLIQSLTKVIGNQDTAYDLRLNSLKCITELLTNQSIVLKKLDAVNEATIFAFVTSFFELAKIRSYLMNQLML